MASVDGKLLRSYIKGKWRAWGEGWNLAKLTNRILLKAGQADQTPPGCGEGARLDISQRSDSKDGLTDLAGFLLKLDNAESYTEVQKWRAS